ncbi:hypothetical protein K435DRAFT_873567 [Dendrothele bispora CBS 962.96]|uniref:C2H2-type domain-containing protein n=1 Tax=Dendrothele bispora (strain CBS 962.96) TaxID=1314807 RepID=A0A4S8KYT6_DENBC|nr:hypothetical protein K435DRAFT_873567 [Dendrothele bispora CBS 962.96]
MSGLILHRCHFPGCLRTFKREQDLTKHCNIKHTGSASSSQSSNPPTQEPLLFGARSPSPFLPDDNAGSLGGPVVSPTLQTPQDTKYFHPYLNGEKCDSNGLPLPPNSPPSPHPDVQNVWEPFADEVQFRLADFIFRKAQMSQENIDELLDIWALDASRYGAGSGPFANHKDMYSAIDNIRVGSAPWKCYETVPDFGPSANVPDWKKTTYRVWYRDPDTVITNMLSNPDFAKEFDAAPYVHVDRNGKRRWSDYMSANYAWRHATKIYENDPTTEGAMYCPIILGADKTTVSVATGHVEYHPLYLSIGNLHNSARRGHRNSVVPIGFLAIPKADRKYDSDVQFRLFKKQLYHSSLAAILSSLRPGMTTPVIRQCPDGYYRRVIYDLGAFIADYPEQVYLCGIVQGWCPRCMAPSSNLDIPAERRSRFLNGVFLHEYEGDSTVLWDNFGIDDGVQPFTTLFPRADIHEMISADLLHQIIKGCFKDMLVQWSLEYLAIVHGADEANKIIDDIDHRIALVPAFPGLRRFPHGRRFKQWTGDDSKALMKVFLSAVAEHLPENMMKCLSSFLDFCYLVRRSDINEDSLKLIQDRLDAFHFYRQVFLTTGVRQSFCLPRMHSMVHYPFLIQEFGAPNGLCSTITESRHITAVKRPWRRSNRWNALSQMLLTNQRIDKLLALRADLVERGLVLALHRPPPDPFDIEQQDVGAVERDTVLADVFLARTHETNYPHSLGDLANYIQQPLFPHLVRAFLQNQLYPDALTPGLEQDLTDITSRIFVYHSAVAHFYAPSDTSGIRGMTRERIRSTPFWRGRARRDCVLVVTNQLRSGFRGMSVARVFLFFSFKHDNILYQCALIHWFNAVGQRPDVKTGMWMVKPSYYGTSSQHPSLAVVHIDTILRGVHILPVYGRNLIPSRLHYSMSLDIFSTFYVNHYADHHANEIIF